MTYVESITAKNETRTIRDLNGQQMLAMVQASTTASKAYAVGDYLILNDKIYKVTAAIASGGTITVGTNVEEAKVGTELTELNRQISELETDLNTKADVIIDSTSGSIASFADGADDMPIKSLVVNIEPVQAGSGDPLPSNVRPITGRTGCTIGIVGVNWLPNNLTFTDGLRDDNGNQTASDVSHYSEPFPIKPNTLYGATGTIWISGTNPRIYFLDVNKNWISRTAQFTQQAFTFTTPENCYFIQVQCSNKVDLSLGVITKDGVTSYTPYVGNTSVAVSWQSEAGSIYGGTLDVISGVLTVNSLLWRTTWGAGTNSGTVTDIRRRAFYPSINADLISRDEGKCNVAPTLRQLDVIGAYFIYATQFYVTLPVDTPDSTAIELYYKTEQKQTYQLTPKQINTLLGQNNIYSDVGSIADVQYPADTKLYIDGKIAELQALVLEN